MKEDFKLGDLVYIAYNNYVLPVIFIKETPRSIQYLGLNTWTKNYVETSKKYRVSYINSKNPQDRKRVVKADFNDLTNEEQFLYKEIIKLV